MNKNRLNILFVSIFKDDLSELQNYFAEIKDIHFEIDWAKNYRIGLDKILKGNYDLFIINFQLDFNTGIDLLLEIKQFGFETPVVILNNKNDGNIGLQAIQLGAADYLIKEELDYQKFERSIRYTLERADNLNALKISEDKYKRIFEESRDMIYLSDVSGRLLDFNKSAMRIFGYSRDELLAINVSDLYYQSSDRQLFLDAINRTGAVSNYEVILKNKAGFKKYCLISGSIQRTIDNEINYLGVIHDITRRKKAERELAKIEKLDAAARLIRSLAHEIRNPLTNIILSSEQLKDEIGIKEYDFYFEIINRNSKRINQLLTDLFNSSNPAGVSKSSCDINEVVENAIALAKDRIQLKEIEIERDLTNIKYQVFIDRDQIEIALLNIIINGIEAMPEKGGLLKIKTNVIENVFEIIIEDNGKGVPKENLERLFEPYFTSKQNGLGLGLASSQTIIQLHHGSIDVESELGKGTKFIIHLDYDM